MISLFDGKGTNILGLFPLPASVKLVELPIDTIKATAIEKYGGMWGVGVIFSDGSNFFLPPYFVENPDGGFQEQVKAIYLMGSRSSRPYGYLFDSWDKNNVFCFGLLTKRDAKEITQLIKSSLSR